jgi:hypothetical protein
MDVATNSDAIFGMEFSLEADPIDEFINWSGHEEIKRLSDNPVELLHKSPTIFEHSHQADCPGENHVQQEQDIEVAHGPAEQHRAKSGIQSRPLPGRRHGR